MGQISLRGLRHALAERDDRLRDPLRYEVGEAEAHGPEHQAPEAGEDPEAPLREPRVDAEALVHREVPLQRHDLRGDLGIELTDITDEHVRGRMAVDRRHLHPMGYVHGGAWVAFADTIAAWGTLRHLPEGKGFTTVELKMNVLASARAGDELSAVGEPLHVGARTHVWEVRVFRAQGERLSANFICTQIVL